MCLDVYNRTSKIIPFPAGLDDLSPHQEKTLMHNIFSCNAFQSLILL